MKQQPKSNWEELKKDIIKYCNDENYGSMEGVLGLFCRNLISKAKKEAIQEFVGQIRDLVLDDVPHKYQERLLNKLGKIKKRR